MVTVLGVARRWLRREGPELRYGREIGYEWYLLHQPVIVAAAYWVITWRLGAPEQLVALLAVSISGTWLAVGLLRVARRAARSAAGAR
jgi:peptidoglycan/LPS O-acetylase OafA/YrhL